MIYLKKHIKISKKFKGDFHSLLSFTNVGRKKKFLNPLKYSSRLMDKENLNYNLTKIKKQKNQKGTIIFITKFVEIFILFSPHPTSFKGKNKIF